MEVSNQAFRNGLLKRQSDGGVTAGNIILPIGAIIGIAIVGSVILFGVLTVTIMHFLRSRYKPNNGCRDLDFGDDNEEDILDALRSTRPSERGMVTKIPNRMANIGTESLPKEWTEIPLHGPRLDKSRAMTPAYAFEITGLRDSWPLVGWVESPSTVPLSVNKHLVINSGSIDRRTSCSAFPLSVDSELAWPQPTLSRPSSYTRGHDDRPIQWSGHSAKSSITSLKRPSSTRKSVSDNQLTSILRSTSQRLKEAHRQPLSRSLSVMSQVSGAPPTTQPPSPPGGHRGESREALIEPDNVSLIDSARSSVLNSISQTPSPQKMALQTPDKTGGNKKGASPAASEKSEPDGLCPPKTPDVFIPAALTSPSKRGPRADQRYKITVSSTDGSSARVYKARVYKDDRHSLLAEGGSGISYDIHSSNEIDSASDPFLFADLRVKTASKSKSIRGPRPLIRRQDAAEQSLKSNGRETLPSLLRIVSGNQKSPTKSTLVPSDLMGPTQENPFQWSPQFSPLLSPGQKPTGIKPKGHQRHRTVRLSHISRPASVAVVLEEPENGSAPPRIDSNQSKIPSSRPPSVPIFEPFLASKISSDRSHSATMSVYDYCSSGGAFPSENLVIPGPSRSPTRSIKKSRRRGCNFSIDVTRARDIAPLEATTSNPWSDRSLQTPKSAPAQFLNFDISKDATALPTFTSRLCGPTSPPPSAASNSVTASVSLLRRMNSQVSTYSTASLFSDYSNGSPTIPELRGGGQSPTKRGSEGTKNYLRIGVKTPNPTLSRGRARASGILDKSRDYRQSQVFKDGLEYYDALGLVMPILENSTSKQPSLEPLTNVHPTPPDWPSIWPKWPSPPRRTKAPAAQLRPMSSAPLSQENCHSCNKPLSPPRLNPRDSTLASRYHDHCFKYSTCNEPLGAAFAVDKMPYCKKHYYEKVNEICNVVDSPGQKVEQDRSDDRLSEVMTTPLKKRLRHEIQLEMPSPHGVSPKSMIKWRGSLGLYDEMGFLKSSPDTGHDAGSFGLGPMDDLNMGT
jgi:hypothetical protein